MEFSSKEKENPKKYWSGGSGLFESGADIEIVLPRGNLTIKLNKILQTKQLAYTKAQR